MLQITTTPIETHRNIVLTERERMQTKLHALASMAVAAAEASSTPSREGLSSTRHTTCSRRMICTTSLRI